MGPRPFSRGNPPRDINTTKIGALQWGRDLSAAETGTTLPLKTALFSFNGAATFQPRKPVSASLRAFAPYRFNGAATFQPRKPDKQRNDCLGLRLASMGPRPFSRGNAPVVRDTWERLPASMGPRPFSRGNRLTWGKSALRGFGFNGAATFQPRKRGMVSSPRKQTFSLQWGRDLSAAETCLRIPP